MCKKFLTKHFEKFRYKAFYRKEKILRVLIKNIITRLSGKTVNLKDLIRLEKSVSVLQKMFKVAPNAFFK